MKAHDAGFRPGMKVVADPKAWKENLAATLCVWADAVPVYLQVDRYNIIPKHNT